MPFVAVGSEQVYYQVDGSLELPVIMLLNGIMMSTVSWDRFVPEWSRDHCLVRLDFFDQGQSSKRTIQYPIEDQVDAVAAVMDHLSLKNVYLVGISYGASVAMHVSVRHPLRITKLVLANAVAYTNPWLQAVGDGWNAVAKTRDPEAYYGITIPYIYSQVFYHRSLEWMKSRRSLLLNVFGDEMFLDAMIRLTNSARHHDLRVKLQSMEVPTLVLGASLDVLTPVRDQNELMDLLPNGTYVEMADTGHASMYEQPDIFKQVILNFLNKENQYE